MSEIKTCVNCKHRELLASLLPCSDCEDLQHDFTVYTNWEPRDHE